MFLNRHGPALSVAVALMATLTLSASVGFATGGSVGRFDLGRFGRLDTIDSGVAADEFGTQVVEQFLATAPAAEGGGRIFYLVGDGIASSISAAELSPRKTARMGEAWGPLGHPPGLVNAVVMSAPSGRDTGEGRAVAAPAVLVVAFDDNRFTREARRVTGQRGTLFGWRVAGTDSADGFSHNFIVTAPLEDRGRRRHVGAVYKFETQTGRQAWRFKGKRAGELLGYDLRMVADTNADGFPDLLVGAPGARSLDPPGSVYLLSGRDGKVLRRLEAPEGAVLFGYTLTTGSVISAFEGIVISAPVTPKGRKPGVGTIYVYPDLDSEPRVFEGRRRNQWFGISLAMAERQLFVGSFEGSRKDSKNMRGSVSVLLGNGDVDRTLFGTKAGEYFGRSISRGRSALAIGAPGAPPWFVPE